MPKRYPYEIPGWIYFDEASTFDERMFNILRNKADVSRGEEWICADIKTIDGTCVDLDKK